MTDHLAEAAIAYATDLETLAGLNDDQIDYLTNLREVKDPLSDGIEHDGDEHV